MRSPRLPFTSLYCFIAASVPAWTAGADEPSLPPDSPLRRAPEIARVPLESLPKAERLGSPEVRALLGYTRRVLRLPDRHTLAVFSFSSTGPANWLFLIDSRDLSAERFAIPNNDIGSHGGALGQKDGNIYVMPYGTGRAYRFVVKTRSFEPLETGLPGGKHWSEGERAWDAFGASNGRIYFGTYPHAWMGEFDPVSGTCELWKDVAPRTTYATTFSEDADGRVRFRAWGPDEAWMSFDPLTRKLVRTEPPPPPAAAPKDPLPAPPPGDDSFRNEIACGGRRFAASFPTGRFWEALPKGELALRGDPQSPAEVWMLETAPGAVIGISHFGVLLRYDLASGAFTSRRLDNRAPAANAVMFIEAIAPDCAIGSNYSQQNLFKVDPETGRIEDSDRMVFRTTGETLCAVGLNGKGYLGTYVRAILSVFDPARPFEMGKNPRELTDLSGHGQVAPCDAATDGRWVYICSKGDYNRLGGALAVIDPRTEKVDAYPQLIPDQNLTSIAWDPGTKLLWGGTDRWGQKRSHPPTRESSVVYAFDPESRAVAATLTVWPGSDETKVLGAGGSGVLVAAAAGEVALIHAPTREILFKGKPPMGIPRKVRRGADGLGYCLCDGLLCRWNLERNALTPVAAAAGCEWLTEAKPGLWLMSDGAAIWRARVGSGNK